MKEKDKSINIFEPFFCDFTIESVERVDDFLIKMNFKNPPGLVAFYNDVTDDITFNAQIFGLNYLNDLKKDVKERFNSFKEQTKYKIKTKEELFNTLYDFSLDGKIGLCPSSCKWVDGKLVLTFQSDCAKVIFNPQTDDDTRFTLCIGLTYCTSNVFSPLEPTSFLFTEDEWDLLKATIEDYYMDAVD